MHVEQNLLDSVSEKLKTQNAIRASLICPIFTPVFLVLWYALVEVDTTLAPVMLTLSGVLIGAIVRVFGKGYGFVFSIIGLCNHLLLVLAAFALDLTMIPNNTLWATVYFLFYTSGAALSVYLSKTRVAFYEHKAYYKLVELNRHNSFKMVKNRWFVAVPIASISTFITLSITAVVVSEYRFQNEKQEEVAKLNLAYEQKNNRAIDVSPSSLSSISTELALKHAFAFYKGYFPAKSWQKTKPYPRSSYKTKTILNFLINARNEARAKFILGIIELKAGGIALIVEAAKQGDIYAKIFQAKQFGCEKETQLAIKKLNVLRTITTQQNELAYITEVLDEGFNEQTCDMDFNMPDFLMEYVF
jgi:hypothetical protein